MQEWRTDRLLCGQNARLHKKVRGHVDKWFTISSATGYWVCMLSANPTRDHVLLTGYQVGLEFAM